MGKSWFLKHDCTMKLIKLEILNLASLDREGGEVINFEEGALKNSTIFSIVGPTGSGKSTLLDAICLALYNRAPRYPRKSGDQKTRIEVYGDPDEEERNRLAPTDGRNILSRGKKSGYSKLTFLANDGCLYRAEWHVRFLVKNYENAHTRLFKITMRDERPEEGEAEWASLPQIIGLDYEQFLRTVLIAQGSFANFLTAKENERYELLEKLIGCEELYTGIAEKIRQRKREADDRYTAINADYAAYERDIISAEEELEELEMQIGRLEEEERRARKELEGVKEALKWFDTEAAHIGKMAACGAQLAQAQQDLADAKEQIERLRLHDATIEAVALYKEAKEAKEKMDACGKELDDIKKKIEEKDGALVEEKRQRDELGKKAAEAAKSYEQQKPHIDKARSIKGELNEAAKAVGEKQKALADCETASQQAAKAVTDNARSIEEAQKALADACAALAALQKNIAEVQEKDAAEAKSAIAAYETESKKLEGQDAGRLQAAVTAAHQRQHDLDKAIGIRSEIEGKRKSQQDYGLQRQQLDGRNKAIEGELQQLAIKALETELETLTKTHTLMTGENWAQHRHDLGDGQPCPLCGATMHPYAKDENLQPVVDELESLIGTKRKELAAQNAKQQGLIKEQSENCGKLKSLGNAEKLLGKELAELDAAWEAIHSVYPDWEEGREALEGRKAQAGQEAVAAAQALKDYNDLVGRVEKLRKAKEARERQQNEHSAAAVEKLRAAEQKKTDANTLAETEKGKTDNLVRQKEEKAAALAKADQELKDAAQVVADKARSLQNEVGDKDPDTFEAELAKAKEDAVKAVEAKESAMAAIREAVRGLEGRKEATAKTLEESQTKFGTKTDALRTWISDYNAAGAQRQIAGRDIAEMYAAADNWEAIRRRQKELDTAHTTAKATLESERSAYAAHQEKKPEKPKEEFAARKEELERWDYGPLTDAKARKQRHDTAKQMMGDLFDRRQEAETEKTEWEEIADAIGADGKTLRKIAQCYTLRFLIEHANAEIRKFNSRYELQQVRNSLGMRVVDHDRADTVRDTTSLSGGEAFIVSLGLALGLSSLSSRNISFENLFIDEGFGTLDPDTLATVIDALAALQSSQGKKVGVISHTDTMSERITTQIRVIKNGQSGSSHIEIYPN